MKSNRGTIDLFDLVGILRPESSASIGAVREQEIRFNLTAVNVAKAKTLRLPLLGGQTYTATQRESEGLTRYGPHNFTWSGKIAGADGWTGDVVLTFNGRAVSGIIYSPTGVYEIIPGEDYRHLLVEIDHSRFPPCRGGASTGDDLWPSVKLIEAREDRTLESVSGTIAQPGSAPDSAVVDDGSQIDVLLTYTAAVRSVLGGTAQAQAFAQQSIAASNTAYQNSAINTRLRLVQTEEVGYPDNSDIRTALDWVTNDAGVGAVRNTARADMVALLTENATDACGIAWLMTTVGPSFSNRAFSVTQRSCAVGNLTFPHELGHNQACDHNPENGNAPGNLAFPYAFGHWNASASFRTVMSYSNPCPSCTRIPNFSNPSVTHNGSPTGVSNQRDNARVINNTALTVAQFRDSGGGGGGGCSSLPISTGQTINGSLATNDCRYTGTTRYVDLYTFNATAGQQVSIAMNGTFDTYLYLVDSNNFIVAEDDDGGPGLNSRIPPESGTINIPATGTYTIHATSFGPDTVGSYDLTLSSTSTCPTALPITRSQAVGGNLQAGDCQYPDNSYYDAYTFSGTAGEQIHIVMNSGQFNAFLFLFAGPYPGGTFLTADNDGGGGTNARIPAVSGSYTLPATGSYTILANSLTAGEVGLYSLLLSSGAPPPPGNGGPFDYDGDNRTDYSVFRPSNGAWYLQQTTAGFFGMLFGFATDRIAPADYDGDGRTDIAVYRPSDRRWYILNSATGTYRTEVFGLANDLPAPADYDGDGRADICIFRQADGTWYYQRSSNGTYFAFQFGGPNDKPTVGDFDADGRSDFAVYRMTNSEWYQHYSSDGSIHGERFGFTTDRLAYADYDGDGRTDLAIFRPSDRIFYIRNSQTATYSAFFFGIAEDIPTPGDYDGDGRADISVFRPSNGHWYRQNSSNGSFNAFQFGLSGDKPTPTAYQ